MPILRDIHGDTIAYHYPPSDSVYIHNTIIIKFKEGALNTSLLCYTCSTDTNGNEYLASPGVLYPINPCRQSLLAQKFAVDSGILLSSTLASAIKSLGGTYLKRMTIANPCKDTLSITRLGDTIGVDYYNWMALEFDNDTTALTACAMLNIFHRMYIDVADLNYVFELCSDSTPRDKYYAPKQISFSPEIIGMPTAWNYEVGTPSVRVAVIDLGGLDYRHCDLGGQGSSTPLKGSIEFTDKVVGGWNFTDNDRLIYKNSSHGTACAGIIGALTNRGGCSLDGEDSTVAGIAGGWGTLGGAEDNGQGVSLLGYATGSGSNNAKIAAQNVISAILQAIPDYPGNTKHGDAAHVINASIVVSRDSILGGDSVYTPMSEATRRAVYETYKHGVSFVAARGNIGGVNVNPAYDPNGVTATPEYPASYDGNWVISVGAAKRAKTRMPISGVERFDKAQARGRYGVLDLIAPGGYENPDNTYEATIFTTDMLANPGTAPYSSYRNFANTSAATPHVAGVVALMRSSVTKSPYYFSMPGTSLEPEDYEGILQATALRLSASQGKKYSVERAWGHLQADTLYKRINVDNYRAKHYSTIAGVFDTSEWKDANNYFFTSNLQKINGEWKATTELITGANSGNVGYIRELTQTDTIDTDEWDTTSVDLFVWARGGKKGMAGGYSAANPNHKAGWAEVINGDGANTSNPNSTDSIYVPGIFHKSSMVVKCRTYQFKIVNTNTSAEIHFPADSSIQCNYTVFGKRKGSTSVRLWEEAPSEPRLTIKPNPALEFITVQYALPCSALAIVEIIDVLGRSVISPIREYAVSGVYSQNINISHLPEGLYFCKYICNKGSILIQKFIIGARQ
jgi:hypothetical protein